VEWIYCIDFCRFLDTFKMISVRNEQYWFIGGHQVLISVGGPGGGGLRRRDCPKWQWAACAEPVEAVLRVPRGGGEDGGAALVPVLTTAILFSTMDRCVGGFEIPAIIMLTLTRLLHGHHHAHARCLRPRLRVSLRRTLMPGLTWLLSTAVACWDHRWEIVARHYSFRF
jgi:hypothetical protein